MGKLLLNHYLTAVSRTIVDDDDLAERGVDIVLKALETTSQELAGIPVDDGDRNFGASALGLIRRIALRTAEGDHYRYLGTLVRPNSAQHSGSSSGLHTRWTGSTGEHVLTRCLERSPLWKRTRRSSPAPRRAPTATGRLARGLGSRCSWPCHCRSSLGA